MIVDDGESRDFEGTKDRKDSEPSSYLGLSKENTNSIGLTQIQRVLVVWD